MDPPPSNQFENWERKIKKKVASRKSKIPERQNVDEFLDPRGFEYFDQLPQEIKLAIFDYFPFVDWVLKLSPVSSSWRKLVTQCNRQKILLTNDFYPLTFQPMPFPILYDMVKNYQIYGLDLEKMPALSAAQLSEIFAASKKLSWVTIGKRWGEENVPTKNILPNTVSSVAFESWTEYQAFKDVFPSIKELRVNAPGIHKCLEHFRHPNLKTLQTVVRSQDEAIDVIARIRSVAPNIEALHLQISARTAAKKRARPRAPQELITKKKSLESEEQLEKLAVEMNIKLYCRNLYDLMDHPDLFIESFVKQGLPYSYYIRMDRQTLLTEACHHLSLPIVKFLLENGHTTIERECGAAIAPKAFSRLLEEVGVKKRKSSRLLFSPRWELGERSKAMIDYLLAKGFDVNRVVDGESVFGCVEEDIVMYILQQARVDLKHRIDDEGNSVIHYLVSENFVEGLRIVTEKLSQEEIRNVFSVKNYDGQTPLHQFSIRTRLNKEMIEFLIGLDLGSVWDLTDNANEHPLLTLIRNYKKNFLQILSVLLPAVPTIPTGLVSALFAAVQGPPDAFIATLHALADRSANFNEIINGDPAITKLENISVPVLRALADVGVEFNVADSKNETLLFHLSDNEETFNQVVEILVKEFGLNVNHVANNGKTPLIVALDDGRDKAEIAKLLELGANPNRYSGTVSPLLLTAHYTAQQRYIVELLLQAGATPNMKLYNETKTKVAMPLVSVLNDS
eukprot:TRINITY_DN696_c0_g1_i1.p1 TRINITY_DN696_c0_g1~~TRINITY_DN696_c0_g1_i1.p1  ORF type:complete len:736 (+),score=85.14 TRINITY_DN696_c0_g1_i1:473-2680(+)